MGNLDVPEQACTLTYDEAVALLPDGDEIHILLDGVIMLGADCSRGSVLRLLATTTRLEATGPAALSMGHGMAAWDDEAGTWCFIETKKERRN